MSFIVVEKLDKKVIIVGEVLLSNDIEKKYTHRFDEDTSCIKNIIINNHISLSFAGNVSNAEKATNEINSNIKNRDIILDILKKYSSGDINNENSTTDFIVYFGEPYYKLYIIQNGKYLDCEKCYIGSQDAYKLYISEYQYDNINDNRSDINEGVFEAIKYPDCFDELEREKYSIMVKSVSKVIEAGIRGVGGFVVPLVYDNNKLSYMSIFISNKTISLSDKFPTIENNTISNIIGNNENGDYAQNLVYTDKDFIAVHLPLAKLGVIYIKNNIGFMYATGLKKYDEIDFFDMLEKEYNVDRRYSWLINHREQDFTLKANEYFNNKDYERAILFYNRAIKKMFEGTFIFEGNISDTLNYLSKINDKKRKGYLYEGLKINLYMRGISFYELAKNYRNKEEYQKYLMCSKDDFNVVLDIDYNYDKIQSYNGSTIALLSLI